jgi:hypothetical protein
MELVLALLAQHDEPMPCITSRLSAVAPATRVPPNPSFLPLTGSTTESPRY